MCTVICRWRPDERSPLQLLALRDELASRDFDLPGAWWPGQPRVVGGRDRLAGGTWCASDVGSAVTAVVLNRRERPVAAPGAPSRGALPLVAVAALQDWPRSIELAGMASFNLVLATPGSLTWWCYDGATLLREELAPGTHLFTPIGLADGRLDERFSLGNAGLQDLESDAANQPTATAWSGWLPILQEMPASSDPLDLLVRIPHDEDSFETVFGQFIAARPGSLRLDYVRTPDRHDAWTLARWMVRDGTAQSERNASAITPRPAAH